MLNELAKEVYEIAKTHGWHDEDRGFPEVVALCHSELSEALEEYRSNRPNHYYNPTCDGDCTQNMNCPDCSMCKPEGIAVEMIDCMIRILDWCGKEGIDVDYIIREKIDYNKTRPYRHGGKKC